ncbi:hypothetical protein NESM_000554200 [Novymonas esmeraldas]|uniref:Uncharacterized protein n=1 Tax=Novymonas esmeraldas TaxID=1808958 RepID=A0AAW0ET42_9TRYP
MSTAAEAQAELDALRAQNTKEEQEARAALAAMQADLHDVQEAAKALEEEKRELCLYLDHGRTGAPPADQHTTLLDQDLRVLVDCDDSRCC